MKILVLTFVLFIAQIGLACDMQLVQFMGKVANHSQVPVCSYEINFTMFNTSTVCEFDISEARAVRFEDKNCALQDGDQVSGRLVKQNGLVVIED